MVRSWFYSMPKTLCAVDTRWCTTRPCNPEVSRIIWFFFSNHIKTILGCSVLLSGCWLFRLFLILSYIIGWSWNRDVFCIFYCVHGNKIHRHPIIYIMWYYRKLFHLFISETISEVHCPGCMLYLLICFIYTAPVTTQYVKTTEANGKILIWLSVQKHYVQ